MSTPISLTTRTPSGYAQEPKPQEPKPQETKPQEPKPQEPKPQETKPQETKPRDQEVKATKPALHYDSKCPHGEHFYACPCCS